MGGYLTYFCRHADVAQNESKCGLTKDDEKKAREPSMSLESINQRVVIERIT